MKDATKMKIFVLLTFLGFMITPRVDALTTFGKTNPQNQNPPPQPTPVGKSRACKMESDCLGIQNTSCLADTNDGKTRCLCADYSAPINGACNNILKPVRSLCNDDLECVEGAHCIQGNSTTTGKRCYCREGYVEDNHICSGSSPVLRISLAILLSAVISVGRIFLRK